MIKLVIFDFDDTLCMTEEACFELENAVLADMGLPPMARAVHQHNWGIPLEKAIQERVSGIDANKYMKLHVKKMSEFIKTGHFDHVPEGNLQVLDKLITAGYKLALLTSRVFGEVQHMLEEDHPLNQRIALFHYKESAPVVKPDPRVFDNILRKFEVKPTEAVYIGDLPNDGICANKAGLKFIVTLESGLRTPEDFIKEGIKVDKFVNTLSELLEAITSLTTQQ